MLKRQANYFLASPPRPCYLQHLNNYKLILCDVSFVDDTWKGSHRWYADYHGTWASEGRQEGQAPLDFAKGCFPSFEGKKSNFTTFGHPLEKILPTPIPLHLLCKRVQQVHLALLT